VSATRKKKKRIYEISTFLAGTSLIPFLNKSFLPCNGYFFIWGQGKNHWSGSLLNLHMWQWLISLHWVIMRYTNISCIYNHKLTITSPIFIGLSFIRRCIHLPFVIPVSYTCIQQGFPTPEKYINFMLGCH